MDLDCTGVPYKITTAPCGCIVWHGCPIVLFVSLVCCDHAWVWLHSTHRWVPSTRKPNYRSQRGSYPTLYRNYRPTPTCIVTLTSPQTQHCATAGLGADDWSKNWDRATLSLGQLELELGACSNPQPPTLSHSCTYTGPHTQPHTQQGHIAATHTENSICSDATSATYPEPLSV